MSHTAVSRLIDILTLEEIEPNLFRGTGAGGETPFRIFGGQVISQALRAAYHTVPGRMCHSLHAYFMRPGDVNHPVVYHVDRSRDGGSFTTRRVTATQKGEQILVLAGSFHKDEPGFDHQHQMPDDLPSPDSLRSRVERLNDIWNDLSDAQKAGTLKDSPIDIREVDPRDMLSPSPASDEYSIWFRLREPVAASPELHHCLLAYASDLYLSSAALRPSGATMLSGKIMAASLDHAMWFHRPLDFTQWHLYHFDSPSASNARGFNRGTIYDAAGRLVASSAQEALLRPITR